jgi:DNA (cytosine-5)-methyltransferase 1
MEGRRPPLVLLENVTGFLTSHRGEDFKQAMMALNNLGYAVDAFILDAANFVPQSRQRLFVVGVLEAAEAPQRVSERRQRDRSDTPDTPGASESAVRPKALADYILRHPEIRWNIRQLPAPPETSVRLRDILEDLPDTAPEWWSAKRTNYLLDQMSARHREMAERMIAGPEWSYGTVFRRMRSGKSMAELRTDGIAGCLRTPRGGSGRQILLKAGYGKCFARLLTPREAARLMGADEYAIDVPLNQALFGFGDAVCVPVIEWIAQHYLNPVVNELIHGQPLCARAVNH